MRKIHVQSISMLSIAITIVLGLSCIVFFMQGRAQFNALQDATEVFITCENDAKQLQSGSDYLTEQVRLATMTGDPKYIDAYFKEANDNKQREAALADLKDRFQGTDAYNALRAALEESNKLMQIECHAMRLTCEANEIDPSTWPEIEAYQLDDEDYTLSEEGQVLKAQNLVSNSKYEASKTVIQYQTDSCVSEITSTTRDGQNRAATIFSDIYRKLEVCIAAFVALTFITCILVRKAIVNPLLGFINSIKAGELFPVRGAGELQILAETYNRVYEENEATQMLIKHQAEHDALTDLLNRGSYDKILKLYDTGEHDFALILVDVDKFKTINDTYGHAEGDRILKRVASLLKLAFRNIDHVCRIGGDEFAIIMVEMTSDLAYTIREKIDYVNEQLANPVDGMPKTSLSVGVAFADRENPGESIFKDADKALYHTKEGGRNGCTIYGDF